MRHLDEFSMYGNRRVVLNRYAFHGELKEQPILSFCQEQGIAPDFLEIIWEAFQQDSTPDEHLLMKFDLDIILAYLKKTHHYYKDRLIPELEMTLHNISLEHAVDHIIISELSSTFYAYKKDLIAHIEEEENGFFRYAEQIIQDKFMIGMDLASQFSLDHVHEEDAIEEMIRFVKKYLPVSDRLSQRIFVSKLQLLRRDLLIHAFVEDNVFVPRVLELELK